MTPWSETATRTIFVTALYAVVAGRRQLFAPKRFPRCPACRPVQLEVCSSCGNSGQPLCDDWAACHQGTGNTARHPQAHVPSGDCCVDRLVAETVEALNLCGWATTDSCAGTPGVGLGRPYIGFTMIASPIELAEAVLAAHAGDRPLEDRVLASILCPVPDRWEMSTGLHGQPGELRRRPYLTLPAYDLDKIVRAAGTTSKVWPVPNRQAASRVGPSTLSSPPCPARGPEVSLDFPQRKRGTVRARNRQLYDGRVRLGLGPVHVR